MKKFYKKTLSIILCAMMLVSTSAICISTSAVVVDSGVNGQNITWVLDDEGTLTISGSGEMKYSFGQYNFDYYDLINSVIIEKGITSICNDAFWCCLNLKSIYIPDSVTSIGNGAFLECSKLQNIIIPSSVTSLGNNVFSGCESLISITIPNSITSIGKYAFWKCKNLVSVNVENGNPIYDSRNNCNAIIETATNKLVLCCDANIPDGVICIGEAAFAFHDITSINIPDSVISLEEEAFAHCCALTNIVIPDSVRSIGDSVFYGCSNLINIIISNELTHIGSNMFAYCTSLTELTIPDNIITIGDWAFAYCLNLASVNIPDNVKEIGDYSFYFVNNISYSNNMKANGSPWGAKCVNGFVDGYLVYSDFSKTELRGCFPNAKCDIVIPDSVIDIGENAFFCCEIKNITIPNNVSSIGNNAFMGCSDLTSVILPEKITRIYDGTFYGCSSLSSVTIPKSVISIDNLAFYYCINLKDIYYTSNLQSRDNIIIGNANEDLLNATWHYVEEAHSHFDKDQDGYCDVCKTVVDASLINPCKNAKINVVSAKTVDYKSIVTIKATANDVPSNYYLAIYVNGKQAAKGTNTEVVYEAGQLTSDFNYTVKVIDANGNVQKDSNGKELTNDSKVTCNASFFNKLIAFFKGLFGMLPTVTIKP